MDKLFAGSTIVGLRQYPEGAILEANDDGILKLNCYESIKNEFGDITDYDMVESVELGPIVKIFYDEDGKLRSQREVIDKVIKIALHEIGMESDFEEIFVDEDVAGIYEDCSEDA